MCYCLLLQLNQNKEGEKSFSFLMIWNMDSTEFPPDHFRKPFKSFSAPCFHVSYPFKKISVFASLSSFPTNPSFLPSLIMNLRTTPRLSQIVGRKNICAVDLKPHPSVPDPLARILTRLRDNVDLLWFILTGDMVMTEILIAYCFWKAFQECPISQAHPKPISIGSEDSHNYQGAFLKCLVVFNNSSCEMATFGSWIFCLFVFWWNVLFS